MVTITTFKWVPPFAQGYVRDLRLRWACEEAGIPYEVRLISGAEQKSRAYRQQQPFGQVPVLQDGPLTLFESGAILLHLGEKSPKILPKDPTMKARATTWVFAAMNSVEPSIQFVNKTQPSDRVQSDMMRVLKMRLASLNEWLSGREYLETNGFTIGDMMMACVLREAPGNALGEFPVLKTYLERCLARPAFQKALADQMKTFAENAPRRS